MSDETLEAAIKKTLSSVRAMCNAITRYYDEITINIENMNEEQVKRIENMNNKINDELNSDKGN